MMVYMIDRGAPNPPQPTGLAGLERRRVSFEEGWRRVINELPGHGNAQIIFVGESENFRDVVERAITATQTPWTIYMLRILAHGVSGQIHLGRGIGNAEIRYFQRIRHYMTPSHINGRGLEIHGCNVAQGTAGRRFVQRISNAIGLTVVASPNWQSADNRFQFEGSNITRVEPST